MRLLVATITLLLSCLFVANTTFAYTVKKGDTMTEIAAEHNLSLQELKEINPQIEDLNFIYIGDTINTDKPKKAESPSEVESKLDNDTDLLVTLVRAEAQSEDLVEVIPQIENLFTDEIVKTEETKIVSFLDYDIDFLSRLVKAEAQSETIVKVKPETQKVTAVKAANIAQSKQTSSPEKVKYSDYEIDLLARLVRAEAQTEPFEGKIAVACVVLNRVESSAFPDTIKEVIYERGQFQPVSNGEINKPADSESIEAVKAALSEKRDMAAESLFFYNPVIATSRWLDSRATALVIGQHVFKN